MLPVIGEVLDTWLTLIFEVVAMSSTPPLPPLIKTSMEDGVNSPAAEVPPKEALSRVWRCSGRLPTTKVGPSTGEFGCARDVWEVRLTVADGK